MIVFFIGMVVIAVLFFSDVLIDPKIFWTIELGCFTLFLVDTLGYLQCTFNYLVVNNRGIISKKWYSKPEFLKFSDIKYINKMPAEFGELACYDSDGIQLFALSNFFTGVEKLESILREHGSVSLPHPYPTQEMKRNVRYKKGKKIKWAKLGFALCLAYGILFIEAGFIATILSDFKEFENYKISGIVESYNIETDTLIIKLENDDRIYYVNDSVYDKLDQKLYEEMKKGDPITLHIAYVDVYDRYNISQIEVDDVVYLYMTEAEKSEYSDYKFGVNFSYVMYSIGGGFLALSAFSFYKLKKLMKFD